jgi:8-oxo-dGTP pyrophosphatase MutT (NUDIX family)
MDYLASLRRHVGHAPLLMVGTAVMVIDEHGRLLLLHRSDNRCWGPPGGAVEPGEEIEVLLKPFEELVRMARDGELFQSLHVSTVFFALSHLKRI